MIISGALLLRRLRQAREECAVQKESFESFSAKQEDRVPTWTAMVEAYEADSTQTNPYEIAHSGLNEADIRLAFAREEEEQAAKGIPAVHEVSPSTFIIAGLDLEEQQYVPHINSYLLTLTNHISRRRICVEMELKTASTVKQKTDVIEQRTKLSRNIARFRTLQATYMPASLQSLAQRPLSSSSVEGTAVLVENIPLCLPSALSKEERTNGCRSGLWEIEWKLRDAQCRTALDRLRNQLHIKSRLLTYRGTQVRHQGATTRSRALINRNEEKIRLHAKKYCAAWMALKNLADGDVSKIGWHPLDLEKDIRCMEEPEDVERENLRRERQAEAEARRTGKTAGPGEGRRSISWIWMGTDPSIGDAGLEDGKYIYFHRQTSFLTRLFAALRVEWVKARARAFRWDEEVRLLLEEMRRVLVTLRAKAEWWEQRRYSYSGSDTALAEGIAAYASGQAQLQRNLANRFENMWKAVRVQEYSLVSQDIHVSGEDEEEVCGEELPEGRLGEEEEEGELFNPEWE